MTPNIIDQVSKCKFKPTEFTWIDIGDTPPPTKEQWQSMLDAGIGFLFSSDVDELPMPFERFAVVRTHKSKTPLCYTFERTNDKIVFRMRSFKEEYIAEAYQEGETIHAGCVEAFFNALKQSNPDADMDHVRRILIDLGKEIFHTVTWLCFEQKSQRLNAYTCNDQTNNVKRVSKGKKPLYDWKIIEIKRSVTADSLGGTHATPRGHTRRGHPRKLRSGKTVWVRECMVGDFNKGCVFHDYKSPTTGASL